MYPRARHNCCRNEPVAHRKDEAVPTSFLELPAGRENNIYNQV